MFYARARGAVGEPTILVSSDPAVGWYDVRESVRQRLLRGGATDRAATAIAAATIPGSLTEALQRGDAFLDSAGSVLDDPGDLPRIESPEFLAPVDPPLFRDFMVFEEHFSFGYRWRGLETPEVLYEFPVAYVGNPATIIGPGDEVRWPHYADEMDYELELGIVTARPVSDVSPEDAFDAVLGVTLLNDFSARDIQRREMAAGLGPSKGKNFGSAVGPWIATIDELGGARLKPDLALTVRVNDEVRGRARSSEMIWSIGEIVAWAAAAETIPAGSLLGTGTANGCSGVEAGILLTPGDRVTLEGDRLGTLHNTVGSPGTGWTPAARSRT